MPVFFVFSLMDREVTLMAEMDKVKAEASKYLVLCSKYTKLTAELYSSSGTWSPGSKAPRIWPKSLPEEPEEMVVEQQVPVSSELQWCPQGSGGPRAYLVCVHLHVGNVTEHDSTFEK